MKLCELVLKQENELTQQQQDFLNTHNEILTAGAVMSNGLITLAQNLKKMRDNKLYIEAGYETFEDYSENACGLKQRQAYNYIKILEDLGESFLHSNAKIGISKLSLLTTLSEDERTEVIENTNFEDTSVRELKDKIKELQLELEIKTDECAEYDDMLVKVDDLEKENLKLKEELEQKNNEGSEIDLSSVEIESLNNEISKLKEELKQEKNKPAEKVVEVQEDTKSKEKIKELQAKLKDMTEHFKAAEEQYKISSGQAADLRKQIELNSDTTMVEFKIKFESLQGLILEINNLIEKLPGEKQNGCKNALKKVVEVLC